MLKGQITDKLGRTQDARLLYADAIAGVSDLNPSTTSIYRGCSRPRAYLNVRTW